VTIAEVATAAGVSPSTVSRVLNGLPSVAPDLARRVQAAAAQLEYSPNMVAQSLSLGRTQTVALVVPDLSNPMFHEILRGLSERADRDGYRVLVANTGENVEAELKTALEARRRCDALVLGAVRMPDEALRELVDRAAPVVLINRSLPDIGAPALVTDYAAAMKTLMGHLLELGHRHFAYVNGPGHSVSNADRIAALQEIQARRPDISVAQVVGGSGLTDGHAAADSVLATRATAVIAFNDLVAFGLLGRLHETGVDVPADISVAAFDDIVFARYATPPLTTMAVPHADIGRQAWQQLHAVIGGDSPEAEVYFRPRLEARASTGPAPWRSADGSDGIPQRRNRRGAWFSGAAPRPAPSWRADRDAYVLESGSLPLARYQSGDRTPHVHSPRPFLHPVHTTGGLPLTEMSPVDHRHHYGVSLALPNVNGTTFWGGHTVTEEHGPELLVNHGRQHSLRTEADGHRLKDQLTWYDEHRQPLLKERRELRAHRTADKLDWMLHWTSTLSADYGDLRFAGPATAGRPGAGYGGIFWHFHAAETTLVSSEAGEDVAAVHGKLSPWLAIVQHRPAGSSTVVLSQPPGSALEWFVRASDYVGAGPAIAWDRVRTLPRGETMVLGLRAVILGRALDAAEIRAVHTEMDAAAGTASATEPGATTDTAPR
jgi:LacI family transcriptional regulator